MATEEVRLSAELVPNAKNVLMSVAYKFAGLRERERLEGRIRYEDAGLPLDAWPAHIELVTRAWAPERPVTVSAGERG